MKISLLCVEFAPSIGLRMIHQGLLEKGHDAKLIHIPLQRVDEREIGAIALELVKFCKEDGLIGISCMTNTFLPVGSLAKKLKRKLKVPIVLGGIHPTFKPEECIELADYVCVGEGEEAILELATKVENGQRTDNIQNIWKKEGEKIIKNNSRPLVIDLDLLPLPSFDLSRLYGVAKGKIVCVKKSKSASKKFFPFFYSIITSRGCPFKCRYCGQNALFKNNPQNALLRRRSHENILKELRLAKKLLGNNFVVSFTDDDFGVRSEKDLEDFFKKYSEEIGLPFFCAGRPLSMTEKKIRIMVDAGLKRLQIGIQTINDKVNKEIYNRPTSKEQIINFIKMASKYHSRVEFCYDVLLDTPWEEDSTRLETLSFFLKIPKPYTLWLYSVTLYPGSDFYDKAKKEGLIIDEKKEVYNKSFLALENSYVNSLFILFGKFGIPPFVIRKLISLRNFYFMKSLLKNSTYFLLHLHFYLDGFRNSIRQRDIWLLVYYLTSPLRVILNSFKIKKRASV
jgi:anaerobic magnesium-protoporphyrin IX monomethyl ester cyclase